MKIWLKIEGGGLENRQETMFYSGSRDGLVKIWRVQDNKLRCLSDLNSHSVILSFFFILYKY